MTVSDRQLQMDVSSPVPLIDLEFDVVPRDNSSPQLVVVGPVMISGGKAAAITPAVLSARDDDSTEEALTFVVAQTPMWGFLERSKTTTRSGRSQTSRRVSTFTLSDLREGAVQYVPSNLSKGGPPSDSFSVYVTDGRNRSPLGHIEVAVLPPTLTLPDLTIEDVVVTEGGRKEVEIAVDGEHDTEDAERLVVSMAEAPTHGSVVLETRTATGPSDTMDVDMRDISIADLRTAGVRLVYQHDGSESRRDAFALTLSNGNQIVKKTASVTVQPVNDELPRLIHNAPATVDFGGTVTLSSDQLTATDVDNFDDEIYFVVLSRPKRGALERMISDSSTFKAVWIQVFNPLDAKGNYSATSNNTKLVYTGR